MASRKSSSTSLAVVEAWAVVLLLLCAGHCCHAGFSGCIRNCVQECKDKGGKSDYSCAMDCFNACFPGGSGHPPAGRCARECVAKCINPDPSKMGDCLGLCGADRC